MSAWMQFLQPNKAQAMTMKNEPMMTPVQQQQQPQPTPIDWSGPINSDKNKAFIDKKIVQPITGLYDKIPSVNMSAPIEDIFNGKAINQSAPQAKPSPTPVGKSIGMTQKPAEPQTPVMLQQPDDGSQQLSMMESSSNSSSGGSNRAMGSYEQQIEQALMNSIQKQQGNADRAQSEYDQVGEKPSGIGQVDWTPLMAMADQWNGTNLTRSYSAPTGRNDFDKKKQLLQGALDKADGTVTESQLAYLKMKADERRAEESGEMRRLMFGQQLNNGIEKDVQKYRDDAAPAQQVLGAMTNVEKELGFKLSDYDENTGMVKGKTVDLPGRSIPGIGRVSFYDSKAQDLDTAMSKVFNVELKSRSGSAVTDSELARLRNEFAQGRFLTEPQKLKALREYKSLVEQDWRDAEAAYRPQVVERYQSRGGQTLNNNRREAPLKQQAQPQFDGNSIDAELAKRGAR